jgi:hypothetical protein
MMNIGSDRPMQKMLARLRYACQGTLATATDKERLPRVAKPLAYASLVKFTRDVSDWEHPQLRLQGTAP